MNNLEVMGYTGLWTGFATGVTLGLLFYGGLWITVRALRMSEHPITVTMGSLLIRTVITAVGFLWIAFGGWLPTVACLIGFVLGRIAVSTLVAIGA